MRRNQRVSKNQGDDQSASQAEWRLGAYSCLCYQRGSFESLCVVQIRS